VKIGGEVSVRAPRATVYDALKDARFFASCVDGVQELTEVDATHYTAVFETKIAYMKFRFNVAVEMTRAEPPDTIEGRVEGKPMGLVGRLSATATTRLIEDGAETRIRYEIDSVLTGRLGSIGQPVLKAKAKEMEKVFAARLKAAFERSVDDSPG
jgi:carbon monoxide dehydrogenase subunit G